MSRNSVWLANKLIFTIRKDDLFHLAMAFQNQVCLIFSGYFPFTLVTCLVIYFYYYNIVHGSYSFIKKRNLFSHIFGSSKVQEGIRILNHVVLPAASSHITLQKNKSIELSKFFSDYVSELGHRKDMLTC